MNRKKITRLLGEMLAMVVVIVVDRLLIMFLLIEK